MNVCISPPRSDSLRKVAHSHPRFALLITTLNTVLNNPMVARLVPNKRPRPADSPDAPRLSPSDLLTAARSSFRSAVLDYYSSHHSLRYPLELTVPISLVWGSSATFEADVRAIVSAIRFGGAPASTAQQAASPPCQLRIRALSRTSVTLFTLRLPLHPKNNLGLYLIANDLSFDLRAYVKAEETLPRALKTTDWPGEHPQARDPTAGPRLM